MLSSAKNIWNSFLTRSNPSSHSAYAFKTRVRFPISLLDISITKLRRSMKYHPLIRFMSRFQCGLGGTWWHFWRKNSLKFGRIRLFSWLMSRKLWEENPWKSHHSHRDHHHPQVGMDGGNGGLGSSETSWSKVSWNKKWIWPSRRKLRQLKQIWSDWFQREERSVIWQGILTSRLRPQPQGRRRRGEVGGNFLQLSLQKLHYAHNLSRIDVLQVPVQWVWNMELKDSQSPQTDLLI